MGERGEPELGLGLGEVPHRYIWRDTASNYGNGPIHLTPPFATHIPLIDITRLSHSDLHSALAQWGCFQAINHGIEESTLEKVRQMSTEFFHLPMEEKQKYERAEGAYEGYGSDLVLFDHQSLDWTNRLYLLVRPPNQQNLKYWPQNPPNFRGKLNEFSDKVKEMEQLLLKSMATSLSLTEDSFIKAYGEEESIMYARFNLYPPCTRPDLVLGLKPHADGSALTFLLQDQQLDGLQLLRDGQWFRVPIIPNALFVNIGDQLEIMSNGVFKSPVHRVVTNSERERSTLAMFSAPDPKKEIGPLEELVNDKTRPRLFNKVTNYPSTYFHYFQQGKRPIDAVRI